ncbi:MAG TPA: RMD1 family protein, partial [Parachlamydiaceae bacterium]|nr:RMD1 family protein [Parachlamydiaceae bacterium]
TQTYVIFMDCCAICTAASYNFKPLYEVMRVTYKATLYRDVVYLAMVKDNVPFDAFFFSYGVTVFWGIDKETGLKIINDEIAPFEYQKSTDLETDVFTYHYGDAIKIFEDVITLPDHDILTKLAISHGIAQSVKLGAFEFSLQKTFQMSKQLPEDLAKHGKISLSRKEIRRKMGELFIARNSVNLNMDVLDTPEFFWEYPELDPYYLSMAKYLDVRGRVDILNQRLNVIHDLFDMLGTELNHVHSNRLEWTIIWLIVIEVIISLVVHVFHIV